MPQASLHFTSEVANLDTVRLFIQEATAFLLLDEAFLYHLQLVVVEAVTNVIVHAYDGKTNKPIWLAIETDAAGVTVILRDQGKPFDLYSHPDPDLRRRVLEKRRGGLGVYLMRKLVDELDLERQDNCNILRMRKRIIH